MQYSDKYNSKYVDTQNSYSDTISNLFKLNDDIDMSCCYTTSPSWNTFTQYVSTIPTDSKNLINLGLLHTISNKVAMNIALGVYNRQNVSQTFNATYQFGKSDTQTVYNNNASNLCITRPKLLKNMVFTFATTVYDKSTNLPKTVDIVDLINNSDDYYYDPTTPLTFNCYEYIEGSWVYNGGVKPVVFLTSDKTSAVMSLHTLSNMQCTIGVLKSTGLSYGGASGDITTGDIPLYQGKNAPNSWLIPSHIPDKYDLLGDNLSDDNGFFITTDNTAYIKTQKYYFNGTFLSRLIAGLCLNFTDINPIGTNTPFDDYVIDGHVWTGEMSSGGTGTENWLHTKKEIFSSVNYDTSTENIIFNPYATGGGVESDIQNENMIFMWGDASPFTKDYLTTLQDLKRISNEISSAQSTVPDGMSVIDNVVSIKQYTINLDNYIFSDEENIKIYKWDTGTLARRIKNTKSVSTLCTTTIDRIFNDFRDYAPYTTYKLFLPVVGVVELPQVVVGKQLRINLIVDIVSAVAKYNLQVGVAGNYSTFGEYPFNIGNDVSFTSTNNGLKRLSEKQSMLNIAGSVLSVGVAGATKNPIALTGGILSTAKAINQDMAIHNSNYSQSSGINGSFTDIIGIVDISLIKITHNIIDNKAYGHTTGYLYNNYDTIKNHNGYCICSNVDVQVSCTDTEKTMIKNIMESGFYI